jgi:hypothetical protein
MDYHSEIPTNSMNTPVEFSSCCPELSRQKDITTQANFAAIRNNRLANTPDCPMMFAPLSTLLFYGHPSRAAKPRAERKIIADFLYLAALPAGVMECDEEEDCLRGRKVQEKIFFIF